MSTVDTTMAELPVEETLVARRSRRSTAGNRMEAALAEMSIDDSAKDLDDDVDFSVDKYEEDIFESDFESTDEEAQDEGNAGEQDALDEEKQARKAARTRVEKATAIAHARQKVTFNPEASTSTAPKTKLRPNRRGSLGTTVNAVTGEVIRGDAKGQRHSKRTHTIKNTTATAKRFKKGEERRAAQTPKKVKALAREITQGELIARALDNEEGNIVDHRDYLKLEEEKRKRARVVRDAVEGPLLRWISRGEDIKIQVEVTPPAATPAYNYGHGYGAYNAPGTSTPPAYPYYAPAATTHYQNPYMHYLPPPAPPPAPVFEERTERVNKNYLVHELAQYEKVPKPSWTESMEVIFGDHVKWDQVKVYSGKGRPTSRPKQMCPLTGQPASYLDPRTGVPFSNIWAYETLTKLLNHEFVWSTALGCYVRQEDPPEEDAMDTS
ncbi:YL1 nuclear protein-domain-containing protein [Armillaria nabsnona]|nr:YL1 nuclear protein-domain-containing protein [Armillaria nabsnona]